MTFIEETLPKTAPALPTEVIQPLMQGVQRVSMSFWLGMSSKAAFLFGLSVAIAASSAFALIVILALMLRAK